MTVRRRTRLHVQLPRHPLQWLRWLCAIYVLYTERLVYSFASWGCSWPERSGARVVVVADVQMIALYDSVWERLAQTLPALHARRSWALVRAKAASAAAVVFLGDMLDDGRFVRDDDQYRDYAKNFQRLYAVPRGVNALYVVGNRDVGLGDSSAFSSRSRQRFVEAFGQKTNTVASIGNHTLVLLDAPGLVDEDYHRFGAEVEFDDWPPTKGGAIEFVKRFNPKELDEPVVLFTHIPLARPDSASCGPLRERSGGIRRGVGPGYQNLIGKQTTSFVLEHLHPRLVLSADDMDYCEARAVTCVYWRAGGTNGRARRETRKQRMYLLQVYYVRVLLVPISVHAVLRPSLGRSGAASKFECTAARGPRRVSSYKKRTRLTNSTRIIPFDGASRGCFSTLTTLRGDAVEADIGPV